MATAVATYPKLGKAPWRTLRARAATAPSTKFTPATVAVILGHESRESAERNVVYPMQKFGLIDENGSMTDRGNKWRNDATYAEACKEILDEVYPPELAGFTTDDGDPDRAMVMKWFLQQKFGESNARQMAATYVMIAEKVPEANDKEAKPRAKKRIASDAAAKPRKPVADSTSKEAATAAAAPQVTQPAGRPAIHLDFQIHIDADARPDVIEQVFASMAKHLYPTA